MTDKNPYADAVNQAVQDTAEFLTHQLQASAFNGGWGNTAGSVSVRWNGSKYEVNVPEDNADDAHLLEYGTEGVKPTAVLRKFGKNGSADKEAQKFLAGRLAQLGKDLL